MSPSRPGTLVLQTIVSSLCGSDLHGFRQAGRGPAEELPTELGHESVGIVAESGDERYPVGTRVLHMPVVENGRTFAEFQVTTGDFVVPVPEGLASEHAVFGQQLGTVLWALKHYLPTGAVPAVALITGGGPGGLLFAQILRAHGVGTVILSEPVPWRRELGSRLGAVAVEPGDVQRTVVEHTGGKGAALVIEASGASDARLQCLESVAREGTVGVFGIPAEHELRLDLELAFDRNLTLSAVQNAQLEPGLLSFREALELIEAGTVDVGCLISHRLQLDLLPQAIDIAAGITDGVVKIVIDIGADAGTRGNV